MIHDPDCRCDALGCRIRREGSLQLNTGAARTNTKGRPGSNAEYNGWERGVAGERRKGGTFMPYLDRSGNPIGLKKHADNRVKHHEIRRRQHDQAVSAGHHH